MSALLRTLVVLPIGLLSTGLHAVAATVVGRLDPTSPWVQRIMESWARSWIRLTGIDLRIYGGEHIDPDRSYVVVANHLSNLDVMVCIAAIPLPIRFLAKQELFRFPVLSQAMRAVGIVQVDRGGRMAAIASVNQQSKTVIERGHSLIIYPEGTRSRSGEPQPFKKGAFMMAAAAGMPILPVTIAGTREIWPPTGLFRRGGPVVVEIAPPIETAGLSRTDTERLRRSTEAEMADRFRQRRDEVGRLRQS